MNEVGPLLGDWQEWHRTQAHPDFATQEALDELLSPPVFRVSKKGYTFDSKLGLLNTLYHLTLGPTFLTCLPKRERVVIFLLGLQRWAMKYPREKGRQRYSLLSKFVKTERPEITF